LLGKQLDIKHKSYDAARYAAWERAVWRSDGASNRKHEDDISLEARDRVLGHPHAGIAAVSTLRTSGITENPLWRDRQSRRLLAYQGAKLPVGFTHRDQATPVGVGYLLVPGIAHGGGPLEAIERALQVRNLNLDRRTFAHGRVAIESWPMLQRLADRKRARHAERENLVQVATSALLSDTWSASDESTLRRRLDDVTTNELIEELEAPGRPLGMHAPGKGQPLFGEGQFGWHPDLQPRSTSLPAIYITRQR
jgi:hypothetical protein